MADEPAMMDDQRLTMFMTEVERVACENVRLRDLISYLMPFYKYFNQQGIDKCYFCRLDGSQWCDTHKGGCLIDEVIGDLRIRAPKLPYYSSNHSIKMRDQRG